MATKSILIVEDDITYGMMLKTWLGKKGFHVASASSIARAQKHIESEGTDLILSDLRLPDRDGTDLLKWLSARGTPIPLIIMTGYADIQSAVQAMKLGARDYVAKPVNPDELLKKINEALERTVSPSFSAPLFAEIGDYVPHAGMSLREILKRSGVTAELLVKHFPELEKFDMRYLEEVATVAKYEGYLSKQQSAIERAKKLEDKALPQDADYLSIEGLRLEARQKLDKIRPLNLGQASRISGVSPADITVLMVWLARRGK